MDTTYTTTEYGDMLVWRTRAIVACLVVGAYIWGLAVAVAFLHA